MKFEVYIKYTEMQVPPRCRKSRPVEYDEYISVCVKEVSAAKVQKAFLVSEYGHEERIVILHKGKLYRQYQRRAIKDDDGSALWRNSDASAVNWQWEFTSYSYESRSRCEYLKYITRLASKFLIVGGDVYERCYEPYYSVTTFGLGRNHGGTGFFVSWADKETRKIYGYSAIDHKAAIEGAVKCALRRGDTDSEGYIRRSGNGSIKVLLPECIKREYKNPHL